MYIHILIQSIVPCCSGKMQHAFWGWYIKFCHLSFSMFLNIYQWYLPIHGYIIIYVNLKLVCVWIVSQSTKHSINIESDASFASQHFNPFLYQLVHITTLSSQISSWGFLFLLKVLTSIVEPLLIWLCSFNSLRCFKMFVLFFSLLQDEEPFFRLGDISWIEDS